MTISVKFNPMIWNPSMPVKVGFTIEIPAECLQVRTQEDRAQLAMKLLEAVEAGACDYQSFVDNLRAANGLEIAPWGYPFVPFKEEK